MWWHVESWSDYGGHVFGYAGVLITGLTPFHNNICRFNESMSNALGPHYIQGANA